MQWYHTFDSTLVACYPRVSALSQRRAADASEASLHTLGMFVLALQVQDGAAPVSSGSRVLIDIITKATVINQAVLAILIVISVMSWAIILTKSLSYRRVQSQTAKFLQAFRNSSKFSEVQAVCATLPASPLVGTCGQASSGHGCSIGAHDCDGSPRTKALNTTSGGTSWK